MEPQRTLGNTVLAWIHTAFAPIANQWDKRLHAAVETVAIVLTLIGIFAVFAVRLHLV